MPASTDDGRGSQPVICDRRVDYAIRLIAYGLGVLVTGARFYPPLGASALTPLVARHRPVWWASEARCGLRLLDSARETGSGFAE